MRMFLVCLAGLFLGCRGDHFVEIQMSPPPQAGEVLLSRLEVQVRPLFPEALDFEEGDFDGSFFISIDEDTDGEPIRVPSSYAVRLPFELEGLDLDGKSFELIQTGFALDDPGRAVIEASTIVTVGGNQIEQASFRVVADQDNCQNPAFAAASPCYDDLGLRVRLQTPNGLAAFQSPLGPSVLVAEADAVTEVVLEGNILTTGQKFPLSPEMVDIVSGLPVNGQFIFATTNILTNEVHALFDLTGTPVIAPVGDGPSALARGLLNEDSQLDLVVANEVSRDVTVLFQPQQGSIGFQSRFFGVGGNPKSLALGNFLDGNGADIAVAVRTDNGEGRVTILENLGGQNFEPRTEEVGNSVEPAALAATDLNQDGISDLVLASNGSKDLRLLINRRDGTFHVHATIPLPANATSIKVANLDGDDREDLAVTLENGAVLLLFRFPGDGSFSFGVPRPFFVGQNVQDVALTDLNKDGRPDITALSQGTNEVVCLSARN